MYLSHFFKNTFTRISILFLYECSENISAFYFERDS
jgi:hypothetical protein